MKWSEGLRNRVSIIIRRYTDHMKFYCFFRIFWFYFLSLYIWLYVLCIMYSKCYVYVLLLLAVHKQKKNWIFLVSAQETECVQFGAVTMI